MENVALFRVNANNQESCYQYWPAAVDSSTVYGRFKVKLTAEEKCDDFIVRKFQIGEDTPYLIPVGVIKLNFKYNIGCYSRLI